MTAAEQLPENWPETWSVVRDREDRHSVWPDDKALPIGWTRDPLAANATSACRRSRKFGLIRGHSACARQWRTLTPMMDR